METKSRKPGKALKLLRSRDRLTLFWSRTTAPPPRAGCARKPYFAPLQSLAQEKATDGRLREVATFDHQVRGVTVSEDGHIFVNFPSWSEDVPVSVAELGKDGSIKPYPNAEWSSWRNARMSKPALIVMPRG